MPSTDASVALKDNLCSSHLKKTVSPLNAVLSVPNGALLFPLFLLLNRHWNFQSNRSRVPASIRHFRPRVGGRWETSRGGNNDPVEREMENC